MKFSRCWPLGLFILILSTVTSSCVKKEVPPSDTVVVGISAPPATLDPRTATDATGQRIVELLFSGLIRIGQDLRPSPNIAESWTFKNNQYVFKLRKGFVFSDGTPLDMDDITYSFGVYAAKGSTFEDVFKNVAEWKAIDNSSISIKMKADDAQFLINLSQITILPKKFLEKSTEEFLKQLPGTGPFNFKSKTENEIILEAKSAHPLIKPEIKKLVFRIVRDDNTRYLKTLNQEIDILQNELPEIKIPALKEGGNYEIYAGPGLNFNYLLINFKDPVLQKLAVRRGMSFAINREEIVQYKLENLAQPATSLLAPINPFHNKNLKPLKYDLAEAKRLISEAGANNHKLILKTSSGEQAKDVGSVLAHQLTKAGLSVETLSFEWATFFSDVKSGNFQLATMRWVGVIDPDIYRESLHSKETPPGKNRGQYSNAALDPKLLEGRSMMDFTKRKKIYDEIQAFVLDDLAVIPLWYNSNICIAHKRVKNYVPAPNGSYFPFAYVKKDP